MPSPRRCLAVLLVCLLPLTAQASDLYFATVIVTGRDNLPERARGLAEALPKVLTRLTADPAIAARATADGLPAQAAQMVTSFDYVDRKAGIQISDEQGTRERSFELTVHFDPARIDAILDSYGTRAWTAERPEIGVALLIDSGNGPYLLTRDSAGGFGQRLTFDDDARALAMPVRLPDTVTADDADSAQAAAARGSPFRLSGRMTLTGDGYWNTDWHLTGDATDRTFTYTHTTFDTAIGGALTQSARVLSTR